MIMPDPYRDLFGLDLEQQRLETDLQAFQAVLSEIKKLRMMDLSDYHPAVVFVPLTEDQEN